MVDEQRRKKEAKLQMCVFKWFLEPLLAKTIIHVKINGFIENRDKLDEP